MYMPAPYLAQFPKSTVKRYIDMKKFRILALLLAVCMAAALLAGCAKTGKPADTQDAVTLPETSEETPVVTEPAEETPAEEKPVEAQPSEAESTAVSVTDMAGRAITLEKPAERVVALTAADCEIIYALGAGDTLVGRGEYCDYPAEVFDVPSVQSGYETNIEQILALEPQVLFMSTMAQTEEQVQQLENAEADALCESMQATFAELTEKVTGDGSKSVYFEVSPLEYGLWTAGKHTFMDEVAVMLGLKNCFDDVDGWGEISEEQVLERNPDYIVTISMYYGEGPTPTEEIASRAGWENVTAVKDGKILNLQNNELSRPGPRLADGAKALFELVYGE